MLSACFLAACSLFMSCFRSSSDRSSLSICSHSKQKTLITPLTGKPRNSNALCDSQVFILYRGHPYGDGFLLTEACLRWVERTNDTRKAHGRDVASQSLSVEQFKKERKKVRRSFSYTGSAAYKENACMIMFRGTFDKHIFMQMLFRHTHIYIQTHTNVRVHVCVYGGGACVRVCVRVHTHTHTHYLEEKCTTTRYYHKTHLINLGADVITARCNLSLVPLDLLFFAVHLLL